MRRVVLLASVALIAFVEACAVGPRYRRSSVGMPDGWRRPAASEDSLRSFYDSLRTSRDTLLPAGADTARVPFAYDTTLPGPRGDSGRALQWLDLIQDSVLRQLEDTSLQANRDVRTALAVIDEFRAQYRATRGALLPELTANGQAGRNHQVFGTFGSFTYDSYRATADLSWELDLWGRLRRSTSAARSDLVAREEDRRALQLSLIGDVATAYFDLRAADLNLAIARRTLESRRQTLALARQRLDRGLISELDVRQFEADVATPAASVADLERQVAQQENALSVLVGHNPGAIRRGRALTEMAARIPVPAGVPSALLGNRPDVRSAEATMRGATARIGVAQAAWLPTFTITGQFGTQSTEFSKWSASGTNIWQALAGVSALAAQRDRDSRKRLPDAGAGRGPRGECGALGALLAGDREGRQPGRLRHPDSRGGGAERRFGAPDVGAVAEQRGGHAGRDRDPRRHLGERAAPADGSGVVSHQDAQGVLLLGHLALQVGHARRRTRHIGFKLADVQLRDQPTVEPLPGECERLAPRVERPPRDREVQVGRTQVEVRGRHVADQRQLQRAPVFLSRHEIRARGAGAAAEPAPEIELPA